MEGMKCEEGGNKTAPPDGSGHSGQNQETEQRVGQVQENIGQMMSFGVETEKLAVDHMRQPGQGVPVGCSGSSEGPDDAIQGQTGLHVMVVRNVYVVIEANKIVLSHLPKNRKGD